MEKRIIGPHFFEESITSQVYLDFLVNVFIPEAKKLRILNHHFQQDGAPPHSTREVLTVLKGSFGNRVIARNFPETFGEGMAWAPYSPDLSPLDFFLWGYVKDKVYANVPKSLPELKNRIIEVINDIPSDMLERAIASFEYRLRTLILTEGKHIENILH